MKQSMNFFPGSSITLYQPDAIYHMTVVQGRIWRVKCLFQANTVVKYAEKVFMIRKNALYQLFYGLAFFCYRNKMYGKLKSVSKVL